MDRRFHRRRWTAVVRGYHGGMATLPPHHLHEYIGQNELLPPPEAVELLGDEVRQAWRRDPELPMPVLVGATTDGEWLAGVFMLFETVERQGRTASIRQLVVRPSYRGMGLAGRLLRRAMTLAKEAGCLRVRTTAGFGCPDHAAMYARLDFRSAADDEAPYRLARPL